MVGKVQREVCAVRSDAASDVVIAFLPLDLEVDDEWRPFYAKLGRHSGLCLHTEAAHAPDEAPEFHLALSEVTRATHAPGLEFYDGVIDVATRDGEVTRLRVGSLSAPFHNLLSAFNLYSSAKSLPSREPMSVAPEVTEATAGFFASVFSLFGSKS